MSMSAYPVQVEVTPPQRYDRIQLLVRVGIAIALGALGITQHWLAWLLFIALPVIAASVVSVRGAEHYLTQTGTKLWSALTWLVEVSAYMLLVTDRPPLDERQLRVELHPTGHPSIGSALARLVMSIPSAIALCFVGLVACVLWFIALFSILFTRSVPASIVEFLTGYLRWQARLLAYHASLVEEYPPFSFGDRESKLPTAMAQP
jgi:uncharacterized protein DUF4389